MRAWAKMALSMLGRIARDVSGGAGAAWFCLGRRQRRWRSRRRLQAERLQGRERGA